MGGKNRWSDTHGSALLLLLKKDFDNDDGPVAIVFNLF